MADVATFTQDAIAHYAPDIDIPQPAVLDQVRRNIELQVDMLREFGAVTAGELADLTGSRAKRARTTVDNWRRAHKIVTIRWRDQTLVPGFLLFPDAHPDPVAQPVLARLADQGFSDWQAALWWTVPAPALDGARPVDLLLKAREASADEASRLAGRLVGAATRRRDWF